VRRFLSNYFDLQFTFIFAVLLHLPCECVIGFALKSPPKWAFGGSFGGRGKYIWWEPPRNADLRVFRHLWSRSDEFCTGIAICHKGKGLDTYYSATYMSHTRDQQRLTISEVAADWHEPMVPQCIMWPSIARANGQLDPRCS